MLRTTWTSRNLRLSVSEVMHLIAFNPKQKSLTPYIIRRQRRQNTPKSAWAYKATNAKHEYKTYPPRRIKQGIRNSITTINNSKKEE